MNQVFNLIIIIGILAFIVFLVFMKLTQAQKESRLTSKNKGVINKEEFTLAALEDYISTRLIDIATSNLFERNLTEQEFKRLKSRRKELKTAIKNCNTGDSSSRTYVKSFIKDLLLREKKLNDETINLAVPFETPSRMTAEEKFETVLYIVSKKEGNNALGRLLDKYKVAQVKEDGGYRFLASEVDLMYKKIVGNAQLPLEDKLEVVTQLIYSRYLGFGIADSIREMNIDGVSGGVSGLPATQEDFFEDDIEMERFINKYGRASVHESLWVMYEGKKIHFSFLSFGSTSELRRVVTNLYKHGYPGQLSETNPAIINDMADSSRVVVMRPKLAESWAFFVRKKFNSKKTNINTVITSKNSYLPKTLLKFIMIAQENLALTGGQGSGKTTLLMALVEFINPALSIRVQETKLELSLRRLYPLLNILSLQETETYSGQDGLDLLKKTDGDVTIVGEVATNPVAAWMIQVAQVASKFTVFTHHANTLLELVFSLRNSIISTGNFSDERIAEQQVIQVLGFDCHLTMNEETGERYVERISEVIPINTVDDMEILQDMAALNDPSKLDDVLKKAQARYYMQQTQTQQFIDNVVVEYRDGEYVAVNPISEARLERMMKKLNKEGQQELKDFVKQFWGA